MLHMPPNEGVAEVRGVAGPAEGPESSPMSGDPFEADGEVGPVSATGRPKKAVPEATPSAPESTEGGAEYRPTANLRLQTTVFHRRDRNGIDYMSSSPTGPWVAANITKLNFTGVETSAAWRWRHQLFDVSYTGLRGVSELLPGIYTKYAFNYPIHSAVASWTGTLPGSITARTRIGAMERRARDPYGVWDLYLARNRGPVRPFVQFTNLANARYQEILSIPLPGRAVLGGVEIVIR